MDIQLLKIKIGLYLEREERSLAHLAKRLGVRPDRLHKWLSGENRIPYEVMVRMCSILNLDPRQQVEMFDLAGYSLPSWVSRNAAAASAMSARDPDASLTTILQTNEEVWRHHRSKLLQCRRFVCDLTWGIDLPSYSEDEDKAYLEYLDAIYEACQRNVVYREVMTFRDDPSHFIPRAEAMLTRGPITYNLRFFDVSLRRIPPLLSFTIHDAQEVILGLYRWPYLPVEGEVRLVTRQADTVRLFQDYFDTIWVAAQPIKEGDKVYWETWERIKAELAT